MLSEVPPLSPLEGQTLDASHDASSCGASVIFSKLGQILKLGQTLKLEQIHMQHLMCGSAKLFSNLGRSLKLGQTKKQLSTGVSVWLYTQSTFSTQHIKHTRHSTSIMDKSGNNDSTDSELSSEEISVRKSVALGKEGKRPFTAEQDSPNKHRKKQRRGNGNRSVEAEEDDKEMKQSRGYFYRELEKNCNTYLLPNARGKFPMKDKVPMLIELLTGDKSMPNCRKKNNLKAKWTVIDGELCSASSKKSHGKKKITAYEDIFDVIFKVDKSKKFQRNIKGLAMDVSDESYNITQQMVNLYSEKCHKRDHKVRGVTLKQHQSISEDAEKQRKIDEFIQTIDNCTAIGYFRDLHNEISRGVKHTGRTETTVEEEPAIAAKPNAVEHTLRKEQTTAVARLQPTNDPAVAAKPKAVEDTSGRGRSTTLAHLSGVKNPEFPGDRNLYAFAKLAKNNIKKGRKKGDKRKHDIKTFLPPYGFNNFDKLNVLCWLNSLLMIVLHHLPMHVILSLIDMDFPRWTEMKYSCTMKEFIGHAYDLVRQMIQVDSSRKIALNGNGVIKPYPSRMAQIIRDDVNSTKGRSETSTSWIHPETQVDIIELMIRPKGILMWLNQLDPCNPNFLLPNLQVVEMKSINNEREIKSYADHCDRAYNGPDGVVSILDNETAEKWVTNYLDHQDKMATELFKKKVDDLNNQEAETIQKYQEAFQMELTVQELLDMSYGKVEKQEDSYKFTEFTTFSDYITIAMSTPVPLPHFRKVDRNEDKVTKGYRCDEDQDYKHGQIRLYLEPMPVRYGIKDINMIGHIYDSPKTKEEADGGSKRTKNRSYQIYGLIVRAIGEKDTGSGHFECLVRTNEKMKKKEVWRHFDDDQDIKEYDHFEKPELHHYTIIAVFMKDVTPKKKRKKGT